MARKSTSKSVVASSSTEPTVKRKAGRPKKNADPAPAAAAPKKRGRPKKSAEATTTNSSTSTAAPKRRGRPSKAAAATSTATVANRKPGRPAKNAEAAPAKKRGRPAKNAAPATATKAPAKRGRPAKAATASPTATAPRKRGRPAKKATAASAAPAVKSAAKTATKSKFNKFFVDALKDLYWAENALKKSLKKMVTAAGNSQLKSAFQSHISDTDHHIGVLDQVFGLLGEKAEGKKCDAMAGLVEEGNSAIKDTRKNTKTRDAALILAAQKAEHYEISSYGTLRVYANYLGQPDIALLLQQILDSEKAANGRLTRIAEDLILKEASQE